VLDFVFTTLGGSARRPEDAQREKEELDGGVQGKGGREAAAVLRQLLLDALSSVDSHAVRGSPSEPAAAAAPEREVEMLRMMRVLVLHAAAPAPRAEQVVRQLTSSEGMGELAHEEDAGLGHGIGEAPCPSPGKGVEYTDRAGQMVLGSVYAFRRNMEVLVGEMPGDDGSGTAEEKEEEEEEAAEVSRAVKQLDPLHSRAPPRPQRRRDMQPWPPSTLPNLCPRAIPTAGQGGRGS
jgi:hypothetical protein